MKRVYTWTEQPANRSVTVKGMRKGNGFRKWTQVTTNFTEEAAVAGFTGIDRQFRNLLRHISLTILTRLIRDPIRSIRKETFQN